MKMFKKLIIKILKTSFKEEKQKDKLLRFMFYAMDRNPLLFAYKNSGILNYENSTVSGEEYLINSVLPKILYGKDRPVFLDIGANMGEYSKRLVDSFPDSRVFSFEPNPHSYKQLKENLRTVENVRTFDLGLSNEKKTTEIFTYGNDLKSEHASLYRDVFTKLYGNQEVESFEIELVPLDEFCFRENLDIIDFIKIDTEGNELEILRGGSKMINSGRIKIIQFEFNEMNIISRVFLKDFYDLLIDYKIYRLCEKRVIPLFHYSSINEIFKFQNLVAIHSSVHKLI